MSGSRLVQALVRNGTRLPYAQQQQRRHGRGLLAAAQGDRYSAGEVTGPLCAFQEPRVTVAADASDATIPCFDRLASRCHTGARAGTLLL